MQPKYRLILAFVGGIAVTVLIPIAVIGLGIINLGADVPAGPIESTLGHWAFERSLAVRASDAVAIQREDSATLASGLDHYRENCVICHGAPGAEPGELAQGLNPPAPRFDGTEMDMSDGELFWVVKHGIRMTAMPAFGPTHTDQEISSLVAFLHHLPDLTSEERLSLQGSHDPEGHHHSAPTAANPAQDPTEPTHHHAGE